MRELYVYSTNSNPIKLVLSNVEWTQFPQNTLWYFVMIDSVACYSRESGNPESLASWIPHQVRNDNFVCGFIVPAESAKMA